MTDDPVRLLSQDDDAFTTSLLRSAKEGDRDAARSHKALVLGAAGGAAAGTAVLATAARLTPKGLFASAAGKWILAGVVVVSGGVGAAVLWPRGEGSGERAAPAAAMDEAPAKVAAPRSVEERGGTTNAADRSDAPPQTPTPADRANAAAGTEAPADPANAAAGTEAPALATSDPARAARPATTSSGAEKPAKTNAETPSNQASSASHAAGAPGLAEEVQALKAARDALASGQSARCLDAVNAYFAAFPKGHLSAEARYLRAEALFAGGRRDEARALAASMLAANPKSPYAARLRAIAGDAAPP